MLSWSRVARGLVALFIAVMAVPSYAATITACVNKNSGALRIVALGTPCKNFESPLSWQTGGLTLPFSGSVQTTFGTPALGITNTGGQNNVNGGNAIEGHSTGQYFGSDIPPIGVLGSSVAGDGVVGQATGGGAGVSGSSFGGGAGVTGSSNAGVGVSGFTLTGVAISGDVPPGESGMAGTFGGPVVIFGSTGINTQPVADRALIISGEVTIDGDVHVGGNLNATGLIKSGGSFKIDHPLDPTNKYLFHSFVESPDMKNVYDGVVVLDLEGSAVVTLPAWFQALNEDYRYQLTSIGSPAPGLYVASEIADNTFRIAGGRPGGKVSWQVTGIRHDTYASTHRIVVEQDKRAGERGHLLNPE